MTTADDVEPMLAAESDSATRTLYLSAMLAVASGNLDIIVVGGSAIEVYGGGAYVSGDIDLVGPRAALARTLAA